MNIQRKSHMKVSEQQRICVWCRRETRKMKKKKHHEVQQTPTLIAKLFSSFADFFSNKWIKSDSFWCGYRKWTLFRSILFIFIQFYLTVLKLCAVIIKLFLKIKTKTKETVRCQLNACFEQTDSVSNTFYKQSAQAEAKGKPNIYSYMCTRAHVSDGHTHSHRHGAGSKTRSEQQDEKEVENITWNVFHVVAAALARSGGNRMYAVTVANKACTVHYTPYGLQTRRCVKCTICFNHLQ